MPTLRQLISWSTPSLLHLACLLISTRFALSYLDSIIDSVTHAGTSTYEYSNLVFHDSGSYRVFVYPFGFPSGVHGMHEHLDSHQCTIVWTENT